MTHVKHSKMALSCLLYNFVLLVVFFASNTARAAPNPCNAKLHGQDWLDVFLKADFEGGRLNSENPPPENECLSLDEEGGWDVIDIVKSYEVSRCSNKSNDCFKVKYKIIGRVRSGKGAELFAKPKDETVKIQLKSKGKDKWNLSGTRDLAPKVSSTALKQHLKLMSDVAPIDSWMNLALDQIKDLP